MKLKISKKQKQVGGIIIGIILLAIFFQTQTYAIFSSQVNYGTTASLVSETDEYAIYRISIDLESAEAGYVESKTFSQEFGSTIYDSEGKWGISPSEDVIRNTYFKSDNFKIGGLSGYCDYQGGNQHGDSSAYFKEQLVECKISGDKLVAKFSGEIGTTCTKTTAYKIKGDLWADCKILKQGIECLDDSYCDEGECKNNICQERTKIFYRFENNKCTQMNILISQKTENDYSTLTECNDLIVIEQPETFYRFSENECSEISILPSLKTNNDYNSLTECELNLIKQDNLPMILGIIGLIVLIIVLVFVYKRIKK